MRFAARFFALGLVAALAVGCSSPAPTPEPAQPATRRGQAVLVELAGAGYGSAQGGGGGAALSGLGSTDNAVLRADGTGGDTAQGSGIVVDDSDNMTLPSAATLTVNNVTSASGDLNVIPPAGRRIYLAADGESGIYVLMGAAGSYLGFGQGPIASDDSGSAAAPQYAWGSDLDTGFYRPAANQMGWSAGGSAKLVVGGKVSLTDATATTVATISLPDGGRTGGAIAYTIHATDGTDHQAVTGTVTFAAVNKGGVYTTDINESGTASSALSTGTLGDTWTISTGTDEISIQLAADTSLTPTTLEVEFTLTKSDAQTVSIP